MADTKPATSPSGPTPPIQRHDPPAFLADFTVAQLEKWDELVKFYFTSSKGATYMNYGLDAGSKTFTYQYFDPTSYGGSLLVQPIAWNAFPKELLVRLGRASALAEADKLWPLTAYYTDHFTDRWYDSAAPATFRSSLPLSKPAQFMARYAYRPQVEYCEWYVARDARSGRITKVTFSSEPPDYWVAMWGGQFPGSDITFPDGRQQVLQLYRELVSPHVQLEDLIAPCDVPDLLVSAGGYNPNNKWNTTHGIAHLCAPPNSLGAEIQLGSDATVRHKDGAGNPVTEPQTLICCAGYGGVNRNSDPTIGATVNALARLGAMLTLPNPVGLYMDHIDLSGWETGDETLAEEWVHIARGSPGMIERLEVRPPKRSTRDISDLRIGGEPVVYGGQIAECITVKLNAGAYDIGLAASNELTSCTSRCCASAQNGAELAPLPLAGPLPPGTVIAAVPAGGSVSPAAKPALLTAPLRRRGAFSRAPHRVMGTV